MTFTPNVGRTHATTDAVVQVDGDLATQRCTLVCPGRRRDRGEQSVIATGRYVDDFVRTADGWRFTKRLAVLDIDLATLVELLQSL
jgi:3-phenylpropionate/cinnamic acid dioxygenase small subunit